MDGDASAIWSPRRAAVLLTLVLVKVTLAARPSMATATPVLLAATEPPVITTGPATFVKRTPLAPTVAMALTPIIVVVPPTPLPWIAEEPAALADALTLSTVLLLASATASPARCDGRVAGHRGARVAVRGHGDAEGRERGVEAHALPDEALVVFERDPARVRAGAFVDEDHVRWLVRVGRRVVERGEAVVGRGQAAVAARRGAVQRPTRLSL